MRFVIRFLPVILLSAFVHDLAAAPLATETVSVNPAEQTCIAEGVVEAVRGSVIGADLSGKVTARKVNAGDSVRAGQVLLQIDQRVAEQQAAAIRARLVVAQADFHRQRQLYEKNFLSKAAFDRAEADFKAAQAEAAVAGTQIGLHTLVAPYAGRVAEVDVELGDMVMPGQPLIRMYDPAALRVTARLPQTQVALLAQGVARIEIPGALEGSTRLESSDVQVLPAADPRSQTVEVRIGLTVRSGTLTPGTFARVALPAHAALGQTRVTVPADAIVRRSELSAVYVVTADGRAQLRQVRLGRTLGNRVEILAGLENGEKVALDPFAAARRP